MDVRLVLLLALLSGTAPRGQCLEGGSVSKETLVDEPNGYLERLSDFLVSGCCPGRWQWAG